MKPDAASEALLRVAARTGDVAAATALLDAGADTEACDRGDFTPLARAIQKGHTALSLLLIERGADVNAYSGRNYQTPLHWAARYGTEEVTRALLAHNADPARTDRRGRRPLETAAGFGRAAVGRLLLAAEGHECGAGFPTFVSLDASRDCEQPFRLAFDAAVNQGRVGLARLILRGGWIDTGPVGFRLRHALTRSLWRKDARMAGMLLDHGAALDGVHPGPDGPGPRPTYTPLTLAVRFGSSPCFDLLLERGADPGLAGTNGMTPLWAAVDSGRVEFARALLERGADPNAPGPDGCTPLDRATQLQRIDLIVLLAAAGAP